MTSVSLAKIEFLLDDANYFCDKKELYLEIKTKISERLSLDVSEVRICGSAYWGARFTDGRAFEPGVSDLDVALISPSAFCKCMCEVRDATRNFADQTVFPNARGRVSTYEIFRDYAFGKGLIRVEHLPDIKTRRELISASDEISRNFLDHFEKISFALYDSAASFAVKQATATKRFRG